MSFVRLLGKGISPPAKSPIIYSARFFHFLKSSRTVPSCITSKQTCAQLLVQCRMLRKQPGAANFRPMHKKDKVAPGLELIYQQKDEYYVRLFTPAIIAVYTLVAGTAATLALNYFIKGDKPSVIQITNYTVDVKQVLLLSTFIIPIVMFYTVSLLRNVVSRIYLDPNSGEYVVILMRYGLLKKKLNFTLADIEARPKLTRINRANLRVKGIGLHVSEENFSQIKHYNMLLGYDLDKEAEYEQLMHKDDVREFIQRGVDDLVEKEESKFKRKFFEKRKMKR